VSAVVVTGASGSLGQRVVDLLAADPSCGRVIGIDLVPGITSDPKVEHRVLDLAQEPSGGPSRLDAAVDGATAVIHLAWSLSTPVGRGQAEGGGRSANLVSLGRVLDAASRAGVAQLVHLSSATVYGAWPDNAVPLGEDAALRPNPGFGFAAEKAEAERMVAEWADQRPDATIAILRPAVTVGSQGPALYRALAATRLPRPDNGARPMQFLHIDDLASAVILARRNHLSGIYNVAPDGWVGEDAARTLAGGIARVTLPGRPAGALLAWGWRVLREGTAKEALAYAVHPWVIANDRLKDAGWVPLHTNEEALVTADDRAHWGDLPPSRRQDVALAAMVGGIVAAGVGAVGAGAALAARSRRRRAVSR
jgi:nucleoside-diphosphate-sugar epimerase